MAHLQEGSGWGLFQKEIEMHDLETNPTNACKVPNGPTKVPPPYMTTKLL